MRIRRIVQLVGLLLLLPATLAAVAAPPVAVSDVGTTPYEGCEAGNPTGESVLFPSGEVEPYLAVNPDDPSNLVGAWQQDRWSDGGSRGNASAYSTDRGSTWTVVAETKNTLCNGGDYERASDPWVTFGADGTAYLMSLVINETDGANGMLVSRSIDGGKSWEDPVTLIRDVDPPLFNDKNTITADPTDADRVYAVWDRLESPEPDAGLVEAVFGLRGPTLFARTTDGGETWEPARVIYDPGSAAQTVGNQIVVTPDGTLVNIFNRISRNPRSRPLGRNVAVIRSDDGGDTWSRRATIVSRLGSAGVTDPLTGDPVRTGDIIPQIAVDPASGALYAVWQDARPSGGEYDRIVLSVSTDSGATWTPPVAVNPTPETVPPGNRQAFTPAVRVTGDGTVGISYYDFRNNGADASAAEPLETDVFLLTCDAGPAGCGSGSGWEETRVTAASFDMRTAPVARGYFVGDYMGLGAVGEDFVAFFSQANGPGDPATVFASTVETDQPLGRG